MKNQSIFLIALAILYSSTIDTAGTTTKDLQPPAHSTTSATTTPSLDPESVMNLVVINDVSEYQPDFIKPGATSDDKPTVDMSKLKAGAMCSTLIESLFSSEPTVCHKLLWKQIQNIAKAVEIFTDPSFEPKSEDEKKYKTKLTEYIDLYNKFKSQPTKENKSNLLKINSEDSNINEMFNYYTRYQEILSKNLSCKELNDDFILINPNSSVNPSTIPQPLYEKLKEWDHTKFEVEKTNSSDLYTIENNKNEQLLSALNTLKLKDVSVEQQPYINISLNGHGNEEYSAALSIKPGEDDKPSEFLRALNLFNTGFKTKSLAITSCFIGGKKNIDAYNITEKFNNQLLENIKYPIINKGTQYSITYKVKPLLDDLINKNYIFKKSFEALNKIPPEYIEATSIFNNNNKSLELTNFTSIKFPHTSWFSQAQFDKKVLSISQVDASTRTSDLKITYDTNIILLGANYIPKPLVFDHADYLFMPKLLPTNYHNQNYYFESIQMKNFDDDTEFQDFTEFPEVFRSLFYSETKEPLNMIVKSLQIGTKKLSNVRIFFNDKEMGMRKSGYTYTDEKGQTKEFRWPSVYKTPTTFKEETLDATDTKKALEQFKKIESNIKKSLPEGLKQENISKLELTLQIGKLGKQIETIESEKEKIQGELEKINTIDTTDVKQKGKKNKKKIKPKSKQDNQKKELEAKLQTLDQQTENLLIQKNKLLQQRSDIKAQEAKENKAASTIQKSMKKYHTKLENEKKKIEDQKKLDQDLLNAVNKNNLDDVKKYLKEGASPNDTVGAIPILTYTVLNDTNLDIISELITYGANLNTKDSKGYTALHYTVMYNELETIKFLLDKGANINPKDNDGYTPLDIAIQLNKTDAAIDLINHGAQIDTKVIFDDFKSININRKSIKESIEDKKWDNLIELLLDKGIKPDEEEYKILLNFTSPDSEIRKTIEKSLNISPAEQNQKIESNDQTDSQKTKNDIPEKDGQSETITPQEDPAEKKESTSMSAKEDQAFQITDIEQSSQAKAKLLETRTKEQELLEKHVKDQYQGKIYKDRRSEKYKRKVQDLTENIRNLIINPKGLDEIKDETTLKETHKNINDQLDIERQHSRNLLFKGERSQKLIDNLQDLHNKITEKLNASKAVHPQQIKE